LAAKVVRTFSDADRVGAEENRSGGNGKEQFISSDDIKYEKTSLSGAIQNAKKCADLLLWIFERCEELSMAKLYLRAAKDLGRFRGREYKAGDPIDLAVGLNVWLYPEIGYAFKAVSGILPVIAQKLRSNFSGQDMYLDIEAIKDEHKRASQSMFILEEYAVGSFMAENAVASLKYRCTPESRVPYPHP
jgi:hypothetical protein